MVKSLAGRLMRPDEVYLTKEILENNKRSLSSLDALSD
jgi:hypothetical protein